MSHHHPKTRQALELVECARTLMKREYVAMVETPGEGDGQRFNELAELLSLLAHEAALCGVVPVARDAVVPAALTSQYKNAKTRADAAAARLDETTR